MWINSNNSTAYSKRLWMFGANIVKLFLKTRIWLLSRSFSILPHLPFSCQLILMRLSFPILHWKCTNTRLPKTFNLAKSSVLISVPLIFQQPSFHIVDHSLVSNRLSYLGCQHAMHSLFSVTGEPFLFNIIFLLLLPTFKHWNSQRLSPGRSSPFFKLSS